MTKKIGTIASIKLENFVTYGNVTLRPGPNLNLIMGPNGTGKSTIVCAIVIGLGGNLNVIGRATTLVAYIRQGFEKAVIEIELNKASSNVIVKRSFTTHGKSQFEIDGRPKNPKDVQEVCKQFNIQVDNLCQFLPQDRVQDFSKLNPQELLLNTQRSVSNLLILETHQELISLRKEHRELIKETEDLSKQLTSVQELNERDQVIVTNIEKQNELKEEIHVCKMRLQWLKYEQCREEFEVIKNDRKLVQNDLNKLGKRLQPLGQSYDELKKRLAEKNDHITPKRRALQEDSKKLHKLLDTLEQLEQSIRDNKNNTLQKINQSRGKQNEIATLEQLMSTTKNQLMETLGDFKTRDNLLKKISSLSEEISKFTPKIVELESERSNILKNLKNSVNAEITLCKNKLLEIENVTTRRMTVLKRLSEDAYQAALWLEENRHIFKGKVYAPMIVVLNVKNPEHSKYIENTVSKRDLLAFTCELVEDSALFVRKVKTEMHLKINVLHSDSGNLRTFVPQISIDNIRKFGFFSYLLGLVDGPEPVLSYLCKTYQIHRIPIGTAETNKISFEVPSAFSLFFSDSFRYKCITSTYTRAKSTSTVHIPEGRYLNHNIDISMQEKMQYRLKQLVKSSDDLKNNITYIETSIQKLNDEKNGLMEKRKEIQGVQNMLDNLLSRLKRHKGHMESLKSDHIDIEFEKSAFFNSVKKTAKFILAKKKEIAENLQAIEIKIYDQAFENTLIAKLTNLINEKEQEITECKEQIQNAEKRMKNVNNAYEQRKNDAKEKYDQALSISNNLPPDNKNFPNKTKFNSLPTTINDLSNMIDDFQAKIDCLKTGDGKVYQDYLERKLVIESTTQNLNNRLSRCNDLTKSLENKGKSWQSEMQELISKIRNHFAQYMEYLECAGDVTLTSGATEQDYDQYGISIKVRYRGAENLQELNRFTQSGGERAVATAVYLLSLQELTDVPFRCVDEINQGMDPINERRVFELLVKATSRTSTSQYFLLTPKLLPNLPYSENVTVLCIYNGKIEIDKRISSNLIDEILN